MKRNIKRFPVDFMFELTKNELETLRTQFATSKGRGGTRYLPFAFTEQGVAMLSSVLNSEKAVEVNIAIMRAFVFMRQYALSHHDLTEMSRQARHDKIVTLNLSRHVFDALNYLVKQNKQYITQKERKRIGFKED